MKEQMETFKTYLEDFARKYRQDIQKNPDFRARFQRMCNDLGVDPLACKHALGGTAHVRPGAEPGAGPAWQPTRAFGPSCWAWATFTTTWASKSSPCATARAPAQAG
jgi:hypothetical protein